MSEYDFDEDNLSGGDYDYDHSYRDERESDEDTADASETDMVKQEEEYTEIKEQMYQDKLANLKKQLQQLQEGVHPEYLKRLKKLEQAYQDRLLLNEVFQSYEIERVEKEYISEKKAAVRDFEEKKIELRENLIAELEEKKRLIESERSTMELTGDSMEVKPVTTRKLRRRPNEPLPIPEKRRRTSPAQLNLLLDENDILDDLKVLNKYSERDTAINLQGKVPKKEASEGVVTSETFSSSVEAKIEDGKLYYDKRWFHRGQPIFFESKETGKCSGVISTIGTNEVWVKKTVDTSKVRIQLAHLQKGKFTIRRRSS